MVVRLVTSLSEWFKRYAEYDEATGKGKARVDYKLKVNDVCCANNGCETRTMNVVNETGAYRNGKLASDTMVYYTAVNVKCEKKPSTVDPGQPVTGPVGIVTGIAGAGSLMTSLGYFIISRKK